MGSSFRLAHRPRVELSSLNVLIDDDEAFLSDIAQRLNGIQQLIADHSSKLGLDSSTRDFTPDAERRLREAFNIMDADGSGELCWTEVDTGVRDAMSKHDRVDMIALRNTLNIMKAHDHRKAVTEDHFIAMLRKKARMEIGPATSLLVHINRQMKKMDDHLGISTHADASEHAAAGPTNHRFVKLLQERNIDTQLVDPEDAADEFGAALEKGLGKFVGGFAGGLAKGMLKQTETLELPTLGIYVRFALTCKQAAYSDAFSNAIGVCIVVVGVVEAVSTYYETVPAGLAIVNYVLLSVFCFEMLLKIFAEGAQPWRYWTGNECAEGEAGQQKKENRWNIFDSTIVILSLWTEVVMTDSSSFNFSYARLFRLVRALRIMRIVRYMPEMLTILDGLSRGARSVVSILCLFFAVQVLYACMGTFFLGVRDPLHFGKFSTALLNLYTMTTGEWVDLLQVNLWGCVTYDTGDYELWLNATTVAGAGAAVGAGADAAGGTDGLQAHRLVPASDFYGATAAAGTQLQYLWDASVIDGPGWHNRSHWFAPAECVDASSSAWDQLLVLLYFFSFVIITVFVLFTMFMGAIAISMTNATEELEKKAAMGNNKNQDWSLMHEMAPKVKRMGWCLSSLARRLLLPDTIVDFDNVAKAYTTHARQGDGVGGGGGGEGKMEEEQAVAVTEEAAVENRAKTALMCVSYSEKLRAIESSWCTGGKVYLMFLDAEQKYRMQEHGKMVERAMWAFRFLLDNDNDPEEEMEKSAAFAVGEDKGTSSLNSDEGVDEAWQHAEEQAAVAIQSLVRQQQAKRRVYELNSITIVQHVCDPLLRAFAWVSYMCFRWTQHWSFKGIMITTIALLVGEYIDQAQQGALVLRSFLNGGSDNDNDHAGAGEQGSGTGPTVLKVSQWIFLGEFIVKLLANGLRPWGYFYSYWNVFDFVILVVGFSRQPAFLVARMLRVFRVMHICGGRARRNFEAFVASILSFRVIGTLWLVVIYLYAIAGVNLFGGNDPLRFKNAGTAAITLFWASTMDGLSGVMFTNVYGCNSRFSSYGDALHASECTEPEAQPGLAAVYFGTFAVFSQAVLLSVFLGVITISLTKTIKTSNDRDKERATIRYFERLFPGNRATLHKLFRAFKDLDMDRDGAITPSEICFRFNQINTCSHIRSEPNHQRTVDHINEWVENLESANEADGEISLPEFLEFMIYSLIEHDEFNVRLKTNGAGSNVSGALSQPNADREMDLDFRMAVEAQQLKPRSFHELDQALTAMSPVIENELSMSAVAKMFATAEGEALGARYGEESE
eukprot:g779.t1